MQNLKPIAIGGGNAEWTITSIASMTPFGIIPQEVKYA